jgi:hypothetical protein
LPAQAIEIRCDDVFVAVEPDIAPSMIIRHHQDNVGLFRCDARHRRQTESKHYRFLYHHRPFSFKSFPTEA